MYYSRVSNRKKGREGSRINGETGKFRHKMINGNGAINGEVDKNTAIRNFIEIKSSNDFVKISTKRT